MNQERTDPTFPKDKEGQTTYIDGFVNNNPAFLKWTDRLKDALLKKQTLQYDADKVRRALYRPFCKEYLYFDALLNQRRYQQHLIFPIQENERENIAICLTGLAAEKPFLVLATNIICDYHLVGAGANTQCFPYYTYAEDGSNRQENITNWALEQFRGRYGAGVSKWGIFHYAYALLHHPQYRERYAEDLKRDLPHIPLLLRAEAFQVAVTIGQTLMDLHVDYEQQEAYPLTSIEDEAVPYEQLTYVTKMKLTPDRTAVVVSKGLTLAGIPEACFRYRLGNRSALEWVLDQYQVSKDTRSGITSDPNRLDDPEYIVRLVKQVVTVSVKTVELVDQLAQVVTQEDWLGGSETATDEG